MRCLLLLLDLRVDPVSPPVNWTALIVLLVMIFVLAVGITAGVVVLLIWLKRNKSKGTVVSDQ